MRFQTGYQLYKKNLILISRIVLVIIIIIIVNFEVMVNDCTEGVQTLDIKILAFK